MHFDTELMRLTRELAKPGMLVTPLANGTPGMFFTPKRGTVYRLSSSVPHFVLPLDDTSDRGYAIGYASGDDMFDPGRAFSDWVIVPWAGTPQMKHVDGVTASARCLATRNIFSTERAYWCPMIRGRWAMPKQVRRAMDACRTVAFGGSVENDSDRSLENWSFVDPSSVKPLWKVTPSGVIIDPTNQFYVSGDSEEKNMPTIKKPATAAASAYTVLPFQTGDKVKYLCPNRVSSEDGRIEGTVLCAGKRGGFDFGIARTDDIKGGYWGGLWGVAVETYGGTDSSDAYVFESEYETRKAERDERLKPKIVAFERGACVEANAEERSAPLAKQPYKSVCVHSGAVGFVRSDDGKSDTVTVYYAVEMPRTKLKATGKVKRPGCEVV